MDFLHQSIDYGVLGLLLCLSVVALALALERFFVYRATRIEAFADRRELELHLSCKLHLIATIGANAPYIGLLGTVLGIMLTFSDIGTAGFDTTADGQSIVLVDQTKLGELQQALRADDLETFYTSL